MELNEFQKKIDHSYKQSKERQRERYSFARSLGFSSREASKMQGWSEQRIKDFANARTAK